MDYPNDQQTNSNPTTHEPTKQQKSKNFAQTSSVLIFIFIVINFINGLIQVLTHDILDIDFYGSIAGITIFTGLWIINNISFLLLPFAIKNKAFKVIGFIITSILSLYWIIANITNLLRTIDTINSYPSWY